MVTCPNIICDRKPLKKKETLLKYSSVPNRRVGRNKRAGGKILRKH